MAAPTRVSFLADSPQHEVFDIHSKDIVTSQGLGRLLLTYIKQKSYEFNEFIQESVFFFGARQIPKRVCICIKLATLSCINLFNLDIVDASPFMVKTC